MFELSLPKLILIALVVLVLFGRGKVADLMGEFGKGVKSFKQGMADEDGSRPAAPPSQITVSPAMPPAAAPVHDPVDTGSINPGPVNPVGSGQV